jgi:hypothetical protein
MTCLSDPRIAIGLSLLACLSITVATPAAAQERAYAGGLAGVTFQTVSSGVFAGNGGVHVGRGIFMTGKSDARRTYCPRRSKTSSAIWRRCSKS